MGKQSGPQRRALRLSRLGAVRRAKALRRAVRLQQRYLTRLNLVNEQTEKALIKRQTISSALQALTDRATEDSPPSPYESGEGEMSASVIEDAVLSEPSTTTDPTSEYIPTESSISTSETSSDSADATGESESLSA